MTDRAAYRRNLRHVVRPDDPAERASVPSFTITDWQALWLQRALRYYRAYEAESQKLREIARAYEQYLGMVVRQEGRAAVSVYVHTPEAAAVISGAIEDGDTDGTDALEQVQEATLPVLDEHPYRGDVA